MTCDQEGGRREGSAQDEVEEMQTVLDVFVEAPDAALYLSTSRRAGPRDSHSASSTPKARSSQYARQSGPSDWRSMEVRSGSSAMRNRRGERGQPCFRPLRMWIVVEWGSVRMGGYDSFEERLNHGNKTHRHAEKVKGSDEVLTGDAVECLRPVVR